jgi:hypothetical protein
VKPLPDTQGAFRHDTHTGGMGIGASRELGLERIGRTTRFLAVGGLVVGGILSAAVAKAVPGRSTHAGSSPAVGSNPGAVSSPTDQALPSTDPALNPPAQAPQPSLSPPVVSSGGS